MEYHVNWKMTNSQSFLVSLPQNDLSKLMKTLNPNNRYKQEIFKNLLLKTDLLWLEEKSFQPHFSFPSRKYFYDQILVFHPAYA